MSVQKFFENRGIRIPLWEDHVEAARSWADGLAEELPFSATFYVRFPDESLIYLSGTRRTKVIVEWATARRRALVFHITKGGELTEEDKAHIKKLQKECEEALFATGWTPSRPSRATRWPEPGQVVDMATEDFFPIWSFDQDWQGVLVACLPVEDEGGEG